MGPTDLALAAAAMITSSGGGVSGLISDLTTPQKRWIADNLTATMQAIYTIAPAIYKRGLSADLAAPVTASVTTTDGSDVVTTAYAFSEGCSLLLGGVMNEIRTEGGVNKLRFPFVGTSGVQSAVFYHDCVVLDSTVAEVKGPVSVVGGNGRAYTIDKLVNRAEVEECRRYVAPCRRYWVEPFLSNVAPGVSVSGTLSPDAVGSYSPIGVDPFDQPMYARSGKSPFLVSRASDGGAWTISRLYLTATKLWTGPVATSPAGDYTEEVGADGTATVAIGDANEVSTLRLRILPIPDERITIGYDVSVRAPSFTVADLGTDDVASTKALVVAEDYHALFVRPIFLQMWTGSPWFKGSDELRQRLAQDDQQARRLLEEYRPQQECNRRLRPF